MESAAVPVTEVTGYFRSSPREGIAILRSGGLFSFVPAGLNRNSARLERLRLYADFSFEAAFSWGQPTRDKYDHGESEQKDGALDGGRDLVQPHELDAQWIR